MLWWECYLVAPTGGTLQGHEKGQTSDKFPLNFPRRPLLSSGVSFTIELVHDVSGYRVGNILPETALKPAPLRGPVESSKNLILSTIDS